jgi:hypothetical protein
MRWMGSARSGRMLILKVHFKSRYIDTRGVRPLLGDTLYERGGVLSPARGEDGRHVW